MKRIWCIKHFMLYFFYFGDLCCATSSNNDENVIVTHAMGNRNDNGNRMLSFCCCNSLKIGGSLFQHKDIHKGTWRSPDGGTVNQYGYAISRRWASSLQDVRVYRGADVASDHHQVLLVADMKMKLKAKSSPTGNTVHNAYNVEQLKVDETSEAYNVALENRFEVLQSSSRQCRGLVAVVQRCS